MTDLQSIREEQTRTLRTMCAELMESNPFYGPKLKEAGFDPETVTMEQFSEKMPFTTRAEWTQNQIDNPEYAEIVKKMKAELEELRTQYDVPPNQVMDISNPDMRYHSATMRKRALERDKKKALKK